LPDAVAQFLRNSGHALRFLYAGALAIVVPTVLLPVYFFVKSQKAVRTMQDLVERFASVATFYLVFDLLGLLIVIFRNISG
jgi:cytochrome c biogenesis protein CcdA